MTLFAQYLFYSRHSHVTAQEATTAFWMVTFSIYVSGYHDYQEPASIWMLLTFLYFVNEKLANNVQRNIIHKRAENVK